MIKHYKLLLLVLSISLIVLACGPGDTGTAQPKVAVPGPKGAAAPGAGWEKKWNDTLEAAKKEGVLSVYTSDAGASVREVVFPVFKNTYGITIEVLTVAGEELYQKTATERQRGLYLPDVHIAGSQLVTRYKGWLVPLEDSLILPEIVDTAAWRNGKLPFLDTNRTTMALTGGYWSYILVNSELVKEGELKSYRDLLQPKWKEKIIMFDPSISGPSVNWVVFIRNVAMGPEEGDRFLRQLAAQNPVITRDYRLQAEWLARGKYPVALAPGIGAVTPLQKSGAPMAWVRMTDGGLVHPSGSVIGIADQAPHPNGARVLLNWLLSREGQSAFSRAYGQPATRLGVATEGIDPFIVPRPDEKAFLVDEAFLTEVETKGKEIGKEIFGHLK